MTTPDPLELLRALLQREHGGGDPAPRSLSYRIPDATDPNAPPFAGDILDPRFGWQAARDVYRRAPHSEARALDIADDLSGEAGLRGRLPRDRTDTPDRLLAKSAESTGAAVPHGGYYFAPRAHASAPAFDTPSDEQGAVRHPAEIGGFPTIPAGPTTGSVLSESGLERLARQMLAQLPGAGAPPPPAAGMDFGASPGDLGLPATGAGPRDAMGIAALSSATAPTLPGSASPFGPMSIPAPPATAPPLDIPSVRSDFPILSQPVHGRPLVWLDNAATTQKPHVVIAELARFYLLDNSNIHRGAHTLAARATDAFEGARAKVQQFLGAAEPSEIVFVRGTTEGINLVARSCGHSLEPGDEIVLSMLEHHSNIVPWQFVAWEKGARIRVVPITERGEARLDEYARLLGPRTKIVAISQVSNALGTVVPVREMTAMAHRVGARVLIDGAQAVAHMPVDVQEIGADFYVLSGHKLFAPTGIGAVYGRRELLEAMPPWQGGGGMIDRVTFEETTFADVPTKFEAGTPNIADAVGLGRAIDYVTGLGRERIEQYERALTQYGMERLRHVNGLRLIGTAPDKVSVLSFVLAGRDSREVGKALDRHGIAVRAGHHCAQPALAHFGLTSTVRASLALYNTREEIDRLVAALEEILKER